MKAKTEKEKSEREKEIRGFLEKIVINTGIGRLSQQSNFEQKILPQVASDLAAITGQKPQIRKAKKSISGFKLREGQIVGLRVTLRRQKLVDFFERLVTIVLPRVRDFRGLDLVSIDAGGALNIGIREHIVFPEINPEDSAIVFLLGINLVPRKKNRQEALAQYRRLGMPLK